jgi:hypothetical protein
MVDARTIVVEDEGQEPDSGAAFSVLWTFAELKAVASKSSSDIAHVRLGDRFLLAIVTYRSHRVMKSGQSSRTG